MKKLLLIPAALVLSTSVASALDLSQRASVYQSIGNTSWYSKAENKAVVVQAQVPIGYGGKHVDLSQKATVDQSIGNTSYGSKAENKAYVIQAQVPFIF